MALLASRSKSGNGGIPDSLFRFDCTNLS